MAHQRRQINNRLFRPNSPCWGGHGQVTIPKQVLDFWHDYKAIECDCGHVIAWTERATGRVICGTGVATHFDKSGKPTANPPNGDGPDSSEQHNPIVSEIRDTPVAPAAQKRQDGEVVDQKRSAPTTADVLQQLGICSIEEISDKVHETFAFLQQIKFETSYPQRLSDVRLPTNEEHYAKVKASEAALQKDLEERVETEGKASASKTSAPTSADKSPYPKTETGKVERSEERRESAEKSTTVEEPANVKDLSRTLTEAAAFLERMKMDRPDTPDIPERSATPEKNSAKVEEGRKSGSPQLPKNPPPSAVSSIESVSEFPPNSKAALAQYRIMKSVPEFVPKSESPPLPKNPPPSAISSIKSALEVPQNPKAALAQYRITQEIPRFDSKLTPKRVFDILQKPENPQAPLAQNRSPMQRPKSESPQLPENPPPSASAVSSIESALEVPQNPQAPLAQVRIPMQIPKFPYKYPSYQIGRPVRLPGIMLLPANRPAYGGNRNPKP